MTIERIATEEHLVERIKLVVQPADYKEAYDEKMKYITKNAEIPGFRKGMIPASLIKKKFGKEVISEELMKASNEKLFEYLRDNNVVYFGKPIMVSSPLETELADPKDFLFEFELGLLPNIKPTLAEGHTISKFNVSASDELVEKELKVFAAKYGKEISMEKSTIESELELSNAGGDIITIAVKDVLESKQAILLDLQENATITCNVFDLFDSKEDIADVTGYKGDVNTLNIENTYTVIGIKQFVPAYLDEEFFETNIKHPQIKNADDLRGVIANDLQKALKRDADYLLVNDFFEALVKEHGFELPEKFLKRLIIISEENVNEGNVDAFYKQQEGHIKRDVLETILLVNHKAQITDTDVEAYVFEGVKEMLNLDDAVDAEEKEENTARIASIVKDVLKDDKERERVIMAVKAQKIMSLIQDNYNVVEQDLTFEEFSNMLQQRNK